MSFINQKDLFCMICNDYQCKQKPEKINPYCSFFISAPVTGFPALSVNQSALHLHAVLHPVPQS